MVTYLGSLVQLCCVVWREGHCKQISLPCRECSWYMAHTGFAAARWCVLSRSTLLRLQGALQEHHPERALHFMHFPGLSHSGSDSQVLHKGTDSVGPVFCALPRAEQLWRLGTWQVHSPRWTVRLITSPVPAPRFPGCAARVPSQVCCVSPLGG